MIIRNKHVANIDKKYILETIWHTEADLEESKAAMDATLFARSKESQSRQRLRKTDTVNKKLKLPMDEWSKQGSNLASFQQRFSLHRKNRHPKICSERLMTCSNKTWTRRTGFIDFRRRGWQVCCWRKRPAFYITISWENKQIERIGSKQQQWISNYLEYYYLIAEYQPLGVNPRRAFPKDVSNLSMLFFYGL